MSGIPGVGAIEGGAALQRSGASALETMPWAAQTGRYHALGHDFAIRTTDGAMAQYLELVLRPLAGTGAARRLYSVVGPRQGAGGYTLFLDGAKVLDTSTPEAMCHVLLGHVNQEAVRQTPTHVILHASAAEHRGRALLFPARSESGKTTLVAGLVRAGFGYFTDEAAAIDPGSLVVEPYPKALSIDPGSWPLFPELEPAVPAALRHFVGAQWHVDPCAIRADARASAARPTIVVAPRFVPGARTRLEPLSRADALVLLVEGAFNVRSHGGGGVETLAAILRMSVCRRLLMGDLHEAVRLVGQLAEHGD